jgi:hypothetical protein
VLYATFTDPNLICPCLDGMSFQLRHSITNTTPGVEKQHIYRYRPDLLIFPQPATCNGNESIISCSGVPTYFYNACYSFGMNFIITENLLNNTCSYLFVWYFATQRFSSKSQFTATGNTGLCDSPLFIQWNQINLFKVDGLENPFNCFPNPPVAIGTTSQALTLTITP